MSGTCEQGLSGSPRFSPLGYTRRVSWSHRLTCFALTLALSGSPAVLAACMALCLGSQVTAAPQAGDSRSGHSAHESTLASVAASAHAHHGGSARVQSVANAVASRPLHHSSNARLVRSCHTCCADGLVAVAAGVERADTKAFGAAPSVQLASFQLNPATHVALLPNPPVSPPSPTRAPLALRI